VTYPLFVELFSRFSMYVGRALDAAVSSARHKGAGKVTEAVASLRSEVLSVVQRAAQVETNQEVIAWKSKFEVEAKEVALAAKSRNAEELRRREAENRCHELQLRLTAEEERSESLRGQIHQLEEELVGSRARTRQQLTEAASEAADAIAVARAAKLQVTASNEELKGFKEKVRQEAAASAKEWEERVDLAHQRSRELDKELTELKKKDPWQNVASGGATKELSAAELAVLQNQVEQQETILRGQAEEAQRLHGELEASRQAEKKTQTALALVQDTLARERLAQEQREAQDSALADESQSMTRIAAQRHTGQRQTTQVVGEGGAGGTVDGVEGQGVAALLERVLQAVTHLEQRDSTPSKQDKKSKAVADKSGLDTVVSKLSVVHKDLLTRTTYAPKPRRKGRNESTQTVPEANTDLEHTHRSDSDGSNHAVQEPPRPELQSSSAWAAQVNELELKLAEEREENHLLRKRLISLESPGLAMNEGFEGKQRGMCPKQARDMADLVELMCCD